MSDMKAPGKSADVFMVLAEEADGMMKSTSDLARKEALEETEKFLQQYEQKARQIILKTRENARMQASDIAERFKKALMMRIEEASASAMSQIMASVGTKTDEMVQRLQQAAQSEVRHALADAFNGNPPSKVSGSPATKAPPVEEPVKNSEPANAESFEIWLTQ